MFSMLKKYNLLIIFNFIIFFNLNLAVADSATSEKSKLIEISKYYKKNMEGSFIDSYGPDDTHTTFGLTLSEIYHYGHNITNDTFQALGIPKRFWSSYSFEDDKLHFNVKSTYELVTDNGSKKIKTIHVNYRDQIKEDQSLPYGHLDEFIKILDNLKDTKLVVFAEGKNSHILNMWQARLPLEMEERVRVIYVSETSFDFWTRDWATSIETDTGHSKTLTPYKRYEFQEKDNNIKNPFDFLDKRVDTYQTVKSNLIFEGGDIVTGERHIFIGPEAIKDTQKLLHLNEEQALNYYTKSFKKPLVIVGGHFSGSQDVPRQLEAIAYHADLVLSILKNKNKNKYSSDEVVFLNSPIKAMELILGHNLKEITKVEDVEALVNKVIKKIELTKMNKYMKLSLRLLLKQGISYEHLFRKINHISNLKTKLSNLNYKVLEVPGLKMWDDTYIYDFYNQNNYFPLPVFNYTNTIAAEGVAFVPKLGLKLFDEYALRIYSSVGYKTIPIESSALSLIDYGGLRCLSHMTYF